MMVVLDDELLLLQLIEDSVPLIIDGRLSPDHGELLLSLLPLLRARSRDVQFRTVRSTRKPSRTS